MQEQNYSKDLGTIVKFKPKFMLKSKFYEKKDFYILFSIDEAKTFVTAILNSKLCKIDP